MKRLFTIECRLLLPTLVCLFFSYSISQANTVVVDSNKNELIKLKNATEQIFNSQCKDIEQNTNGSFSIDLNQCIPLSIQEQLSAKNSSLGGPNCYSFSLNILGFHDFLYMTTSEEVYDLYLSPTNSFCTEVKNSERRSGDLIVIGLKDSPAHTFVYLTEKYAFNKNGPSRANTWELTTNSAVFAHWDSKGWDDSSVYAFRCNKSSYQSPRETLSAVTAVNNLNKLLRNFQLQSELAGDSLVKLKNAIVGFSQELTDEKIQTLAKNKDNPTVRIQLYGIFGNFYPIQKLHNYLESYDEHKNPEAAKFFEPAVFEYIRIMERTLEQTHPETFHFEGIALFESVENYCKLKKQNSRMCQAMVKHLRSLRGN